MYIFERLKDFVFFFYGEKCFLSHMEFLATVPEVATADESRYSAIIAIICQIASLVSNCVNTSIVIALKLWTLEWRDDDVLTPTVLQGELVDLQKVPAAVADSCVFSGLTAGSLYRLQVVSWSRGLSSDSAVLARTGQSRSANQQPPGLHDDDEDEDDDYNHACFFFFFFYIFSIFFLFFLCILSSSPSVVPGAAEFRTDRQTDGHLAAWGGQLEQLSGDPCTL